MLSQIPSRRPSAVKSVRPSDRTAVEDGSPFRLFAGEVFWIKVFI